MSAGEERVPDRVYFVASLDASLPRRKGDTLEQALERAQTLLRNAFGHWLKSIEIEALTLVPNRGAQGDFDLRRAVLSLPAASRRILLELKAGQWIEDPRGNAKHNGRRVALAALRRRGYAEIDERGRSNLSSEFPKWGHAITEAGIQAAAVLELEQAAP